MKKRYIAAGLMGILIIGGGVAAYNVIPSVHDGSPSELPELGRFGDYSIGTNENNIALGERPLIDTSTLVTGNVDPATRELRVRFWYPSQISENNVAEGNKAIYEHDIVVGGNEPIAINFTGKAIVDAAAKTDEKFPLIIMSHGFGGWAEHYSNLGEHIASRGYVVASIDHADVRATGPASFLTSFGNVVQNRSLDQRQIINHIIAKTKSTKDGYMTAIDTNKIGLIGYSMGGFGALTTAGAPYDYSAESLDNLPDASKEVIKNGTREAAPISALITLAPWGATPDNRSWTAEALGKISAPSLIIAGNQDDVSDFDEGISWIFNQMKGSNRNMLVYREALHNVAGNALLDPKFPTNDDFATTEYMREPVWRSERINAINQHFITAFLDLHLKGDSDKASYLNPVMPDSNDSQWEIAFGEQLNGKLAGKEQPSHWRGFQKRWAVGMEMHRKTKGE